MNSCLNCEKSQNELNYEVPNVDQSVAIKRYRIKIELPSLLEIDRINCLSLFCCLSIS